jgi:hypothetical protein
MLNGLILWYMYLPNGLKVDVFVASGSLVAAGFAGGACRAGRRASELRRTFCILSLFLGLSVRCLVNEIGFICAKKKEQMTAVQHNRLILIQD